MIIIYYLIKNEWLFLKYMKNPLLFKLMNWIVVPLKLGYISINLNRYLWLFMIIIYYLINNE